MADKQTKRGRGRPRTIKSPTEFDKRVDTYVAECVADEKPITWTGMARSVGLYGRAELDAYAKYDGFSQPVKRARLIVEEAYEARLHGNSPTGAIFALKNMGWSDRQEVEHSGAVSIEQTILEARKRAGRK